MSVAVENLTRCFVEGGTPAIAGVSFQAPAGGITTLVGPSGSGKTTVLRIIAGLDLPDEGLVRIDGTDCTTVPPQRRGVGVVFQSYALFLHMTVRDNVAFGLEVRGTPRREVEARVTELLRLVQLSELGQRRPAELSGGQRQRVAIARAILADPRILLLDEATSSLDSESEAMIQDGLRSLRHGRTTFVIAHRLSTIRSADQILVLEGGEIVERGTHAELLALGGRYRQLYDRQYRFEADRFINPGEEIAAEADAQSMAPVAASSSHPRD
jgi:ABC-type multidrug transport system fused ATPase/permease subunit